MSFLFCLMGKELFLALVNARSCFLLFFWVICPTRLSSFSNMHEWSILSWRLEVLWQTPSSFSLCSSFFSSILSYTLHYRLHHLNPERPLNSVGFPLLWPGIQTLFRQKLMAVLAPIFWFQQKKFMSYLARSRSLHFFFLIAFLCYCCRRWCGLCWDKSFQSQKNQRDHILFKSPTCMGNSNISINMKINKCSMQVSIKDKKRYQLFLVIQVL